MSIPVTDIPVFVVDLCRTLRQAKAEAWLVGGAVRDLLRGRGAHDFDIATSATPTEVAQIFGRKRTIPTGEKHGTVTVVVNDGNARHHVEVTTFRGEGAYRDGRRPDQVEFVRSIVEDLRRRDFTMNAIAFDPLDDKLIDPFSGQQDLTARLIRAVGDPNERFSEDGLRALRAVRFAAQHQFALDPPTEAAITATLSVFRRVSAERIRDELIKILAASRPSIGLDLMRKTGLMGEVWPELLEGVGCQQNRHHSHDVWHHTLAVVDQTMLQSSLGPPWIVRLAALLHDVAKPRTQEPRPDAPGEFSFYRHEYVGADLADKMLRHLKFSNQEREHVVRLVLNHMFWYSAEWSAGTVRRFISRVGQQALPDLFSLREGDVRGRGKGENPGVELDALRARVDQEIAAAAALKVADLAIGGKEVMQLLGCPPGPIVGEVLDELLERVLDDASLNTMEKLTELVRQRRQRPSK